MKRCARVLAAMLAACLVAVCALDAVSWPSLEGAGEARGVVVRAERFEVADAAGRVRGWLGVAEDGSAGLTLRGKNDKCRAELRAGPAGTPALRCSHGHGKRAGAWLGISERGSSGFVLFDKAGEPRADLSVAASESTQLPGPRAAVGRPGDGWGSWRRRDQGEAHEWTGLRLQGKGGRFRSQLSVNGRGTSGLFLVGKEGKSRCGLLVGDYGWCQLACDAGGKGTEARLSLDRQGQSRATVHLRKERRTRELRLERWGLTIPGQDINRPRVQLVPGYLHLRPDGWAKDSGGRACLRTSRWPYSTALGPALWLSALPGKGEVEVRMAYQTEVRIGDNSRKPHVALTIPAGLNMMLYLHDGKARRAMFSVLGSAKLEFSHKQRPVMRIGSRTYAKTKAPAKGPGPKVRLNVKKLGG